MSELPPYDAEIASNPFKVFAAIPPGSRYRFLLDDARFFIEGFIKGPVCRGQVALNVIDDRFWVMFFNSEQNIVSIPPCFRTRTNRCRPGCSISIVIVIVDRVAASSRHIGAPCLPAHSLVAGGYQK